MTTANAHGSIPEIVLRHRLRIAREEAGLSVQGLAERMGVARNTVGNAEAGKGTPRKVVLNAWALATGVDIDWLKTGERPHQDGPGGGETCPQSGSNRRPADYKGDVLAFPVRQRGRESDYAGREVAA